MPVILPASESSMSTTETGTESNCSIPLLWQDPLQPRFKESPQYGYGFWLSDYREKHIFYMRGILGQYVIVIPEDHLIIVRLGQDLLKKAEGEQHAPDFFMYIDESYKMLNDAAKPES